MNSCRKGKAAEREAAAECRRLFGTNARRSQQHCGVAGDADLTDAIPRCHVEVKHYAHIAALGFLEQAKRDAKGGAIPLVMMRQNRGDWAIMVSAEDFAALVKTGTQS